MVAQYKNAHRAPHRNRMQADSPRGSKPPRTAYAYDSTDTSTPCRPAGSPSRPTTLLSEMTPGSPNLPEYGWQVTLPQHSQPTEPFGESFVSQRPKSPSKLSSAKTLGDTAKESVLELASEYAESSTPTRGFGGPESPLAKLPPRNRGCNDSRKVWDLRQNRLVNTPSRLPSDA